jgi:hypothetical protein
VPAMLTPGEFVVNKNATSRNLPLLKSINSQKFNGGGKVGYYAKGGLVSSYLDARTQTLEDFQQSSEKFLDPSSQEVLGLLDSKKINKKLQVLPNIWFRAPGPNNLQIPNKSDILDRDGSKPIEIDLRKLYPYDGDILPGIVSHRLTVDTANDYGISAKRLSIAAGRWASPFVAPGSDKSILLGLDTDRSIDLNTKNLKKSEFSKYKRY